MSRTRITARRPWLFNWAYGEVVFVLAAFAGDELLQKGLQVLLIALASWGMYHAGGLAMASEKGLSLPVSEVGRWLPAWIGVVAAVEFAISVWSDASLAKVVLNIIGGAAVFAVGMTVQQFRRQAG